MHYMKSDDDCKPTDNMEASKAKEEVLARAVVALVAFLGSKTYQNIEISRLARVLCILVSCGCTTRFSFFTRALDYIVQKQQPDGGWSDPEETAWAIGAIKFMRGIGNPAIPSAIEWLDRARYPGGGWGRHLRDQARIPITSLTSALVPQAIKPEDRIWLAKEWKKDFDGSVQLSYKAGFFLMSRAETQETDLVDQSISYLYKEQNEDGGFGPWKDHPIGSDPWSTGIVLLGLLSYPELVKREIIEKAVNWLAENQLPNGLWPYHYIEEGSAYAYWGLVEALKYLSKASD